MMNQVFVLGDSPQEIRLTHRVPLRSKQRAGMQQDYEGQSARTWQAREVGLGTGDVRAAPRPTSSAYSRRVAQRRKKAREFPKVFTETDYSLGPHDGLNHALSLVQSSIDRLNRKDIIDSMTLARGTDVKR